MNSGVIIIGISIALISIIIYAIKNKQEFKEKHKKIAKIVFYLFIVIVFILFVKYTYNTIKLIQENLVHYNVSKENQEFFDEFDKKIKEESNYYNEAITKDYGETLKNPYIPEGFEYVEGDIFSGYVIQDVEKNQYVWIPCTNKDDSEILKLEKRDFFDITNLTSIRNYECLDIEYKDFINSAFENGGFYISRFELGKENNKVVSKQGAEIWTNTTREDAIPIVNKMYTTINCRLANGYAYDTALAWIKKNNNIKINEIEDFKNITSGRVKYNNIYDLTDNVMEITLEDLYNTMIYRGFSSVEDLKLNNRYNTEDKEIENYEELLELKLINFLAFRTVLYK